MFDEQTSEEIPEEKKSPQAGGATDAFAPELTERSKQAIGRGMEKLVDRPKPQEPKPSPSPQPPQSSQPPPSQTPTKPQGAPPSTPQPQSAGRQAPGQAPTTGAKPEPGAPQPSPSDVKEPSKLGKLGRALGTAGTAANIARHPKEAAGEAGKALAKAAAKKVAKRALQALTSETVVGPAIIEALDKLSQILKKIPGVSAFSNWCWKNKWAVVAILILLWLSPGLLFAAGLAAGLTDGEDGGLFAPTSPFMGQADQLLLFPQNCDESQMAQVIDKYIASQQPNSPLMGQGQVFVESAKHFGINPFFTVAQAQTENQFATNPRPVAGHNSTGSYNPFGIQGEGTAGTTQKFFDGKNWVRYAKYQSWIEGIGAHDEIIRGYLDQGNASLNGVIGKYVTGDPQNANPERIKTTVLAIGQMMALAGCNF